MCLCVGEDALELIPCVSAEVCPDTNLCVNQVLPALVPAPLETFSWEDMQDIQYMPGQTKLHEYQWYGDRLGGVGLQLQRLRSALGGTHAAAWAGQSV